MSLVLALFLFMASVPPVHAGTVITTFTADTDDGYLTKQDSTYSTARLSATGTALSTTSYVRVGQDYSASKFIINRAILFFDTSGIPDTAAIDNATLRLHGFADGSTTDFTVVVRTGTPPAPHKPLISSDYYLGHYDGNYGTLYTTSFVSGWNNITLTSGGESWISLDGVTSFALFSDHDIGNEEPTGAEYVDFVAFNAGVNASQLEVGYTYTPGNLFFYGAYYEDGTDYAGVVTVTLWFQYQSPVTFTLNNFHEENVTTLPIYFTWNVSLAAYNQTRAYYLHSSDSATFYLFIPLEPINLYLFDVYDLEGVTSGYLEASASVNGTERVFERRPISTINSLPFYMGWGSRYNVRLRCDQGTYLWGDFCALAVQTQVILIPSGLFPDDYPGLNATVTAARVNATYIQVTYSDPALNTSWVCIAFYAKANHAWASAYSTNVTDNSVVVNWYDAVNTTDYLAKIWACRAGVTYLYTISLPKTYTQANPWDGVFDGLGTWPIPASQLVGLFLTLTMFSVFSWYYLPLGMFIGVATGGFLTYIGWMDLPWASVAFALAVVVFAFLQHGKEREREI